MRGHRDELPAVSLVGQMVGRRRSKHNARKCVEYVGTQECHFDSQAEYKYALWLESERKAGRILEWLHHPDRITLFGLRGKPVCEVAPDFSVWPVKGIHEYHEVKGMATAAWRLKRALLEQQYPQVRYVVIDAGHVNPPLLFDDRRKRKAERKKAKVAKRRVK